MVQSITYRNLAAFAVNSSRDLVRWWPRDASVERGDWLIGRPAFREIDGAPPELYLRKRLGLPSDDPEAIALHGNAVASGLTDLLIRPEEGEVYVMLDVNSLYPAVLAASGQVHYPACGRPEYDLSRPGWADVEIEVPADLWLSPLGLPLDRPGSAWIGGRAVVFPAGRFRVTASTTELAFLEENGGRVLDVYSAWSYRLRLTTRKAKPLVDWLFRRKQKAEGRERDRYKAILNYGIGGLDTRSWWTLYARPEYGRVFRLLYWGSVLEEREIRIGKETWLRLKVSREPYQTGVCRAVAALGRVRLARDVLRLREAGVQVFYVDTDCVVLREQDLDRAAGVLRVGDGLGEYSVRWVGRWECWGPKRYLVRPLEGKPYAVVAGYRLRADEIRPGGFALIRDPLFGTEVVSLSPGYDRRRWPANSPVSSPLFVKKS